MSIINQDIDPGKFLKKYFDNPENRIDLVEGQVLLRQYEHNKRIYYIKSGKLIGYLPDKKLEDPIFEANKGSFVGVYSYLSENHLSYSHVIATEPSEIYFCEDDPRQLEGEDANEFLSFLFKIVLIELRSRQEFAAQKAKDHHEVLNKLIKTEKLATLGQLSAGLAHELNNTIGSLNANLRQLEEDIRKLLKNTFDSGKIIYFEKGLEKGLTLTSEEVRKAKKQWPESLKLDSATIKKLSKANIPSKKIRSADEGREVANIWSLGHHIHDMNIAATQATHVVSSIKTMGVGHQCWTEDVDINQTIREALTILKSMTRTVELDVDLEENISKLEGCHGELVQVWINLLKNAVEVLHQHKISNPQLTISSMETEGELCISVKDNGPGISRNIIERIFEPSFTTKVQGISLGLGLGLTIVQRIVTEHNGEIEVKSKPGSTIFTVKLTKRGR